MGAKVAIGPSPHACSNIGSGRPLTADEGCCCGSIRDPNAFKPTQNHPGTPGRKKAEGQANGCRPLCHQVRCRGCSAHKHCEIKKALDTRPNLLGESEANGRGRCCGVGPPGTLSTLWLPLMAGAYDQDESTISESNTMQEYGPAILAKPRQSRSRRCGATVGCGPRSGDEDRTQSRVLWQTTD